MKGKAIIPLVLGLGIGLAAVKVGVDAIKNAKGAGTPQKTVKIVRAKVDLEPYQAIQKQMVELVEIPENSPLVTAKERITSLEDVVGRVTSKAVPQETPVLLSMLAPKDTRPGMVGRIPEGFRAVAVKIDEVTGVAFQIKPGDWVDVIVVMEVDAPGQRAGKRESVAEVILQHVQVAAIGQDVKPQASGKPSRAKPAKSATLFVAKEDVPKLHLASIRGKITLAMRGNEDESSGDFSALRASDAFESLASENPVPEPLPRATTATAAPVPAPRPVLKTHVVTIRRGTTGGSAPTAVEKITFENVESSTVGGATVSPRGGRSGTAGRLRSNGTNGTRRSADSSEAHEDADTSNSDMIGE
ncbi:MAG: Flp pilus assembly protein CpaB [Phycisphaerae bacterium]